MQWTPAQLYGVVELRCGMTLAWGRFLKIVFLSQIWAQTRVSVENEIENEVGNERRCAVAAMRV